MGSREPLLPEEPGSDNTRAGQEIEKQGRIAEIQASIIVAKRFPRNETEVYQRLLRSCARPSFADEAEYVFPRGGNRNCKHEWDWNIEKCSKCGAAMVHGPSTYFMSEALRLWGNAEVGTEVLEDGTDFRTIRSWAWDKETNFRRFGDVTFDKVVLRSGGAGGQSYYKDISQDEREMRELNNRHASVAERNAGLKILPRDFVEDALKMCRTTLLDRAAKDPEAERKTLAVGFGELSVSVEELERYLGHPLAGCSPKELATLRAIWKSIAAGEATWAQYAAPDAAPEGGNVGSRNQVGSVVRKPGNGGATAAKPANAGQPTPPPPVVETIKKEDAKKIDEQAHESGWTPMAWTSALLNNFGVAVVEKVPASHLDAVVKLANGGTS